MQDQSMSLLIVKHSLSYCLSRASSKDYQGFWELKETLRGELIEYNTCLVSLLCDSMLLLMRMNVIDQPSL